MIERCLLVNAVNGRGIKIGHYRQSHHLPARITVRHNPIVNSAAGNVSLSYATSGNVIERNILVDAGAGYASVAAWKLVGDGNVARDNVVAGSSGAVAAGSGLIDGGNLAVDPALDGEYRPGNPALVGGDGTLGYGHLAGMDLTENDAGEPPVEPPPGSGAGGSRDRWTRAAQDGSSTWLSADTDRTIVAVS